MQSIKAILHWIEGLLAGLLQWVEAFASSPSASWALFAVAFVESSVFPIPPDVLLIPLCLGDPESSFFFAAICSIGSVLGGIAGYGIGYVGGRPILRRFFSEKRVQAVQRYYDRYNAWATGIAGLTPLPYKLFTISGGAFEINFKVFLLASIVSRSLRFFAVAGVVYLFGDAARNFIDQYLGILTIAFILLLIGGFWLVSGRVKRASRSEEGSESV